MKYIITESQYKLLTEKKREILQLPGIEYFGGWDAMRRFLESRGNPLYSVRGDLDLYDTPISSLGNLVSVGGSLYLQGTPISSIGKLTSVGDNLDLRGTPVSSLGKLTSVGGGLYLIGTAISSLGNLTSVGGSLDLRDTPLSRNMSEEEIRKQVEIGDRVYLL